MLKFADILFYVTMTGIAALIWLAAVGLILLLFDFAKTVIKDWFH